MPTFTAAYAGARTKFSHLSRAQRPTKAGHRRSCSKSAVSSLPKISRGFADRLERAIFERFARGAHARAQSLPAPKQALQSVVMHRAFKALATPSSTAGVPPSHRLLRPMHTQGLALRSALADAIRGRIATHDLINAYPSVSISLTQAPTSASSPRRQLA